MDFIKKVRCLSGGSRHDYCGFEEPIQIKRKNSDLVEGDVYKVYKEGRNHYLLGIRDGVEYWYHKDNFVEVK